MNIKNFQYYFNSNYFRIYNKLFSEERSVIEAKFLTKFIPNKKSKILDFGCAWGRHLKELAKFGYLNLCGVDFSEALLEKAKENLKDFPNVEFYHSNFVSFKSSQKFDFIFHIYQSFGYEDREYDWQTINNAASLLSERGGYFLDLRNPIKLIKSEKFDFPDGVEVETYFDSIKKRERFTYKFDGEQEVVEFNVYTNEELAEMFKQAGLQVANVFGGFDGADYTDQSERLILVARKY